MSSSMFERHPDQDVLADLAAEVLPVDRARSVEAHVIGCQTCAQLLADAERVRLLLVNNDPGPMPDDVWLRIQGALAVEGAQQTRPISTYGVPPPSLPPVDQLDAPTAAWRAFVDEPEPSAAPAPLQLHSNRGTRPLSQRSRRDIRTEDEDAAGRRFRPGLLVAAAIAGVLVLGGAVVGVKAMFGPDRSGTGLVNNLPGTGRRNVVSTTGTDYTASTLGVQVNKLVASTEALQPRPAGASGSPAAASTSAKSAPVRTAGTVAEPQRMISCLSALGEHDRQPVAVDLATYQGREAAVIVLTGRSGGYDVWVVARSCRPGAEGELAFRAIKS